MKVYSKLYGRVINVKDVADARAVSMNEAKWDESKHPRDEDGKFGTVGGVGEDSRSSESKTVRENSIKKATHSVVEKGIESGHEYGAFILPDGSIKEVSSGDANSIDISSMKPILESAEYRSLSFTHNHPMPWGFSDGDLINFCRYESFSEMTAATHDGKTFTVRKTEKSSDGRTTAGIKSTVTRSLAESLRIVGEKLTQEQRNEVDAWMKKVDSGLDANELPEHVKKIERDIFSAFAKSVANKFNWEYEEK